MSEAFLNSIVTVVLAIVGVATLAVLVSKQAATSQVIQAGSQGLSGLINAAVSPVTGGSGGGLSVPSFSGSNAGFNY